MRKIVQKQPQIFRRTALSVLLIVNLLAVSELWAQTGFKFINTAFENASPLYWEIDDTSGVIDIYFIYDIERESPNRANGHWLFQVQAVKDCTLTFVLNNFTNVWNGKKGIPVSEKSICFVASDKQNWRVIPTELLPGDRLRVQLKMQREHMYLARLQPYTLADLADFLDGIRDHRHVEIYKIGSTVEGRPLEIIRVGSANAPYRFLLRARAHAWEPGGNWVVQGLVRSLLSDEEKNKRYLQNYCIYILPMANKDGVARGKTRFNMAGKDLNRNWDVAANPRFAPENYALEMWIESMLKKDQRPHFAIDFHNDEGGSIHVSRPDVDLESYLKFMQRYEVLMRRHTWFTEGSSGSEFRNPGSIGEGLLERYGIFACVQELNCNWIAGLEKHPFGADWELLGAQMREVFYHLFDD
jgi:hypothetical protein